jgi:hypothetical protein
MSLIALIVFLNSGGGCEILCSLGVTLTVIVPYNVTPYRMVHFGGTYCLHRLIFCYPAEGGNIFLRKVCYLSKSTAVLLLYFLFYYDTLGARSGAVG